MQSCHFASHLQFSGLHNPPWLLGKSNNSNRQRCFMSPASSHFLTGIPYSSSRRMRPGPPLHNFKRFPHRNRSKSSRLVRRAGKNRSAPSLKLWSPGARHRGRARASGAREGQAPGEAHGDEGGRSRGGRPGGEKSAARGRGEPPQAASGARRRVTSAAECSRRRCRAAR